MILSGSAIRKAIDNKEISVDPFDESCINPASLDLHLGPTILVYEGYALDAKKSHHYKTLQMSEERGYQMFPGTLYLMATKEVIRTDTFVTVIDGKSSIGRLGISIHQTAGYGDPGYWGQYTLEVSCMMPVTIYAGMKFCQARFHTIQGLITNYQVRGSYVSRQGPVMGPKPSQAYRQWPQ